MNFNWPLRKRPRRVEHSHVHSCFLYTYKCFHKATLYGSRQVNILILEANGDFLSVPDSCPSS